MAIFDWVGLRTNVFDWVGLRTNVVNTVSMVCQPCSALVGNYMEAYGLRMTGGGGGGGVSINTTPARPLS